MSDAFQGGQYSPVNNVLGGTLFTRGGHYSPVNNVRGGHYSPGNNVQGDIIPRWIMSGGTFTGGTLYTMTTGWDETSPDIPTLTHCVWHSHIIMRCMSRSTTAYNTLYGVESTYLYSPYLKSHSQPQSEVGKSEVASSPAVYPTSTDHLQLVYLASCVWCIRLAMVVDTNDGCGATITNELLRTYCPNSLYRNAILECIWLWNKLSDIAFDR